MKKAEEDEILLEMLRQGEIGLNDRLAEVLERVPETGCYSSFSSYQLNAEDLKRLTAAAGHCFALLRSKQEDILYHGSDKHGSILMDVDKDELLNELLYKRKIKYAAYTDITEKGVNVFEEP